VGWQVLQEREGLALQKCEGRVGPYPPATWALWFRYTFKLNQPCRLGLDLALPGEALLKAASLVLLDNDTSQVGRLSHEGALTPRLTMNSCSVSVHSFQPVVSRLVDIAWAASSFHVMLNNHRLSMSAPSPWSETDRGANVTLSPLPPFLHSMFTLSRESLCPDPFMLASLTILITQQLHIFRGQILC